MRDIENIEHEAIIRFANKAARIGLAEALAQQVSTHNKLTALRQIATNPATHSGKPHPFVVTEMRVL